MNADEPRPDEESLLTRLVACDKAMAAGTPPQEQPASNTPVELRSRLEGNLACIEVLRKVLPRRSGSATPGSPASDGAPVSATDLPFHELGRFRIRRRLGQGAFGMVFLAGDPQLGRDVALKVPRPEALLTGELRERFVREARAAAGLDHPNLVPVYEAGAVGPLCYIASAYCPGVTLSDWLKDLPELPPERLSAALVATLADAVGHAHGRGVVHRDLKPSNVLLQGKRRDPADANSTVAEPSNGQNSFSTELEFVPRITDFGLAKLIGDGTAFPEDANGLETRTGALLGTPNYMAPEQASGKNKEIGPAADVYALGVILYELLTGRTPFRGETILDTLEQVRTREPLSPARLHPKLTRDLETICLKCLQKEPHKRYETAAALAEDLRRYLAHEPIRARPIRAWERGIKWARRKPAQALLLAVCVLAPLVIIGISLSYSAELTNKNESLNDAKESLEDANNKLTVANIAEVKERQRAEAREWDARNFSYVSDMNLAQQYWASARLAPLRDLLQRQLPPDDARDLRGFEWYYWKHLLDHGARLTLEGHVRGVGCVACSSDGKLLASAGGEYSKQPRQATINTIRLWDAKTGRELPSLPPIRINAVKGVTFLDGGRRLAAATMKNVFLFDVPNRKLIHTLAIRGPLITSVAAAAQRSVLALARSDGGVEMWNLKEKAPQRTIRLHKKMVTALAFSADDTMLVSGDYVGILHLWNPETGQHLSTHTGPPKGINGVAISPDNRLIAAACRDATIRLWDWKANRESALIGHSGEVWSIHFAPDGKTLVSAGADATVRVWDTGGDALFVLKGHAGAVRSAIYTPDGRTIVSAGEDRNLMLWDAHGNPDQFRWEDPDSVVLQVAFSPDGRVLATGGGDGRVKLWEPATGKLLANFGPHPNQISGLAFAPDGKHLVVASLANSVHIWDCQTAKEIGKWAEKVSTIAFSPDGNLLVSGDLGGSIRVWDWHTRKMIKEWPAHTGSIQRLVFSLDGKVLASSRMARPNEDSEIKLWEPSTGSLQRTLNSPSHKGPVSGLAFSPDGHTLASGGADGNLFIWDVNTGELRTPPLKGRVGSGYALAFSPDGRTLASTNGEVKLWHAATGRGLATFDDLGTILRLAWSPQGQHLAGVGNVEGRRGVITIWNAGSKVK